MFFAFLLLEVAYYYNILQLNNFTMETMYSK